MEASALHAPALGRRPLSVPLLRLRSDEQLVALFRAGSEDAFAAMHDRYRQRLFAYVRQMLSAASRADAEDVLQDVFVRAYGALRADERAINLRAWLYRVAHNRCIDHLRRPVPPAGEVFELSRTPPLHDPMEAAQRRDDLRRLVADVGRLPDQQRSALLMREMDGLGYADIAAALDVTVPAVKSLLVRARIGLVEAAEARDADCAVIREDLAGAYDRGVKASGRARRHMRECDGCREYRAALRGMRRSFAALAPVAGLGPLALAFKAAGIGGAGSGAAGGGAAAAGGGAGLVGTGLATATAGKVAAVACAAVVATGGAVEVKRRADDRPPPRAAAVSAAPAAAPAAALGASAPAPVSEATILRRTDRAVAPPAAPPSANPAAGEEPAAEPAPIVREPAAGAPDGTPAVIGPGTGGAAAPEEPVAPVTEEPATGGLGPVAQPVPGGHVPAGAGGGTGGSANGPGGGTGTASPGSPGQGSPSTADPASSGSPPAPAPGPSGPPPEH